MSSTSAPTPTPATRGPDSELDSNSLLEVNDTAGSGDTNDTASADHNITLTFTPIDNNDTAKAADGAQKNIYVTTGVDSVPAGAKDTAWAKSRMSYNADLSKLPDTSTDQPPKTAESGSGSESPEAGVNQSRWEESMVHDQGAGEWVQLLLRTEIQKILQEQVNEVLSLVSKHSAMVDTKLHDHESKFHQLEERLTADIKHLDQVSLPSYY